MALLSAGSERITATGGSSRGTAEVPAGLPDHPALGQRGDPDGTAPLCRVPSSGSGRRFCYEQGARRRVTGRKRVQELPRGGSAAPYL